jgi:hypothetical protein
MDYIELGGACQSLLTQNPGTGQTIIFHTTQNPGTGQTIVTSQQNHQLLK